MEGRPWSARRTAELAAEAAAAARPASAGSASGAPLLAAFWAVCWSFKRWVGRIVHLWYHKQIRLSIVFLRACASGVYLHTDMIGVQ